MKIKKCPKCGGSNVEPIKYLDYTEICLDCLNRFSRCPKCNGPNIEPVIPFDYVKQCEDCGHQFSTGEHN